MKPTPRHTDEEWVLPSSEALLAGTLALMTGCAQHSGPHAQRELMAGKVVANLTELARHPDLSPTLRQLLSRLSERWLMELRSDAPASPWAVSMPAPSTVQ